jgi:2-keto-4-pentenoate hydratase/2-oxohepta-3-ene-1,7-dioic acid hydratase in catechol pathway
MASWLRFQHRDVSGFGTLEAGVIRVHAGDMFAGATPTGETLSLASVCVDMPCQPSKMICLWNNFQQLAAKFGFSTPESPLFFVKTSNAFTPHAAPIRRPKSYSGRIVYEGELGVVIGGRCTAVSEAEAAAYIFGYTCVNDVTALDLLKENPSFEQWTRAKSFDTFGPFGPVITTGVDPMSLHIKTVLNGQERQNYPVSDMFFPPHKLVSMLSHSMTLLPGDVIACGTSLGAGVMKEASNVVDVVIDGVGHLSNPFVQEVVVAPHV